MIPSAHSSLPAVVASLHRAAAGTDPRVAREEARRILDQERFRVDAGPRPLRGPLEWIGDRITAVAGAAGRVVAATPPVLRVLVAALVVALAVGAVVGLARRRGRSAAVATPAGPEDSSVGPAELEQAADRAEARGDHEIALRCRFHAGLLRLDARGMIDLRPSLTTGEMRRRLGSATFDELAATFESVVYGGREAGPDDVRSAREGWSRLAAEVGRR